VWSRSSWDRGKPRARQWLIWTFLGLEVDAAHLLRCSSRLEVWLLGDSSMRRAELPLCNLDKLHPIAPSIKHWWFSGKIGRCHLRSSDLKCRPAPGSIPGRCMSMQSVVRPILFAFLAALGIPGLSVV
jgi:hypothetical protein